MGIYQIKLLRHGESTGNAAGYIQGQSDLPLTVKGEHQAQALAKFWSRDQIQFDWIISSPLIRARQTAEIIADTFGVQIEFDPLWAERTFGILEGLSFQEITQQNPSLDFFHPYNAIGEHGESLVDLYLRAVQALQNLLRRPPGNYLVVSHGALLNMTLYAILGLTPQSTPKSPRFIFGNTGYADLSYDPEGRQWRMLSFNTQQHWGQDDYQ